MICKYCAATIPQEAVFCRNCGKRQSVADNSVIPLHPETPSSSTQTPSSPPFQNIQQTLLEMEIRHQKELAQFREELSRQIAQQHEDLSSRLDEFKKEILPPISQTTQVQSKDQPSREASNDDPKLAPFSRPTKAIITVFLSISSLGMLWLLFDLYRSFFTHRSDDLIIVGGVFTIFGTLYLAYDLLGRRPHGPLAWLTLFISYWLLGIAILEPLSLVIVAFASLDQSQYNIQRDFGMALAIILLSGLIAACSSILVGIHSLASRPQKFSWKSFWVGGILGCIFWWLFIAFLSQAELSNERGLPIVRYVLTIISTGLGTAIVGGLRPLIAGPRENSVSTIHLRSKRGCLTGMIAGGGIIAAPAFTITALNFRSGFTFWENIPYAIVLILICSIIGGAAGIVARYLYWRIMNLKDFALGVFGLLLILFATVLQSMDPLSRILGGK